MSRILDMARPAGEPEKTHASAAPVDIAPLGLRPFGLRALNAMRREKNFGGWGASTARSTVRSRRASTASSPTTRRRTLSAGRALWRSGPAV
jgi:hypothetical protein